MLTVVIYRKSSQEFLDKYRSLLDIYVDEGKIAFCFWDETGTDVASALPELSKIVRGERNWKAIIALPAENKLRMEGDDSLPFFEAKEKNPFDFLCNSEEEPDVHESKVPLIRLTQMLGGVPLVNRRYKNQYVRDNEAFEEGRLDENGRPRTRLVVEREGNDAEFERQQRIWDELNDKYSLTCERPNELYLFSARNLREITLPTTTDKEEMNRHESDSSRFWYRNRYPAKTRFLVNDCVRYGNAHYNEDLFRFWMTVLTLGLNDIPTGTLEAYKVYHVNSVVDMEKLHKRFSDYYNRLDGAKLSATRQIAELQKNMQLKREMDELPYYQVEIPVEFHFKGDDELFFSAKKIGLAGDCPVDEESWFRHVVKLSRKALQKLIRNMKITLDRASSAARFASKMHDEEIHEMDEYQIDELSENLAELETEILTFNTYSVFSEKKCRMDLDRAESSACTSMRKRMTRTRTLAAGGLALLIFILGYLPDIVSEAAGGDQVVRILEMVGIGFLVMLLVIFCCLLWFRKVIKNKVKDYNGVTGAYVERLDKSAVAFSDYLSKVSSYMRGRHILQVMEEKTRISIAGIEKYSLHTTHLRQQMEVIESWLNDFELSPLPDKGEGGRSYMDFDFDIAPENNREYWLHLDFYDLFVETETGNRVMIPYPFVTDVTVDRVRLYEKKKPEEDEGEEGED